MSRSWAKHSAAQMKLESRFSGGKKGKLSSIGGNFGGEKPNNSEKKQGSNKEKSWGEKGKIAQRKLNGKKICYEGNRLQRGGVAACGKRDAEGGGWEGQS